MVGNGRKWSAMVGNGRKWSKMVGNGRTFLAMVGNDLKWLEMVLGSDMLAPLTTISLKSCLLPVASLIVAQVFLESFENF